MTFINDFLYFLSGTNKEIISQIEKEYPSERLKRLSLGMLILFSSLLSGLSSFIAIDAVFNNYLIASLVCIFFTIFITLLNSFMLVTFRKGEFILNVFTILPRLFLLIAIALIFSTLLEIRFFATEIDRYISSQALEEKVEIIINYDKQIKEYTDTISTLHQKYIAEITGNEGTKVTGEGRVANLIKREIDEVERRLDETKNERNVFLEKNIDLKRNSLFSKLEALRALRNENASIYSVSWFLFLLVFFIEIAPFSIILLSPQSAYDTLLTKKLLEQKDVLKPEEKEINSRIKLPTFSDGFFSLFDFNDSSDMLDELQDSNNSGIEADKEAIKNDREFVMRDWENVLKRYGTR